MAHPASATRPRSMASRSLRRPRLYGDALRLTTTSAPPRPCCGHRAVGKPHVLADRDPDPGARNPEEGRRFGTGHEPALLVEDAVVGQEALPVDPYDPTSGADGGGVGQARARGIGAHEADHDRAVPAGRGHLLQRGHVVGHEGRLEEQVLGWVSGDGQLRHDTDIGPRCFGCRERAQYAVDVARQIAHDGVELGCGHAQEGHPSRLMAPQFPGFRRAIGSARVRRVKQPRGREANAAGCSKRGEMRGVLHDSELCTRDRTPPAGGRAPGYGRDRGLPPPPGRGSAPRTRRDQASTRGAGSSRGCRRGGRSGSYRARARAAARRPGPRGRAGRRARGGSRPGSGRRGPRCIGRYQGVPNGGLGGVDLRVVDRGGTRHRRRHQHQGRHPAGMGQR